MVLLLLVAAHTAQAQQGTEPITASDLLKIQQLSSVTVSPDGRSVAYVARSIAEKPDEEGEYTYRNHLYWIPISRDAMPVQLTYGDRGGSQPAWHPDGDRLAFVRSVDGTSQIFILPITGGEAYPLTDFEYGASDPQWSPDGEKLLFSTSLSEKEMQELTNSGPSWSDERPGRRRGDTGRAEPDADGSLDEIRAWLDKNADDNNPRVFTRINLQGEHDLEPQDRFRHYFVLDTTQEDAEPVMITSGYYSFGGATWMPDGLKIILSGAPEGSTLHPDRLRDSDLYIVNPDGSDLHRLLDLEGYALSSPSIAPNSRHLAFLARDLGDPGYAQTELGLFALDGRTPPEMLTLGFDRSLGDVKWSQDNWYLYFTAASEGGFPLYRLSVDEGLPAQPSPPAPEPAPDDSLAADSLATPNRARDAFLRDEAVVRDLEIEQLTSTEQGIRDYDVSRATVYYVLTEPSNPYELYASTMDFDNPQRLTDHNASWLQSKRLATLEAYTLRRDTLQIPYWVMRPTDFDRDRDYPMLLEIHGGPSAMWGPGEASMWHEFQFMAAQGYGVVFSNPRGSGGYGHAYKALNYQDWGDGPAGDVLAVATDAIRKNSWLDEDRQVVTGGSYAGYLTAWIVGHDDRFKAAVAQRGVYDLSTFFGEGNAWRLVPSHFGGYPWEDGEADSIREVLNYNSPLTYVDQITTPLLIIHSDKDLRTGVIQSEVLYKSLKALDRPVEYVRYPDAGHDLSRTGDPKQRMDRILRIYEFMERYIGPGASSASLD